ncbi:MAG TPA: valine--tRNA ligase [Bryobacteraceae bacterium]|nr:valine--tRNA ligase [Bryobacteraceae bacterium]
MQIEKVYEPQQFEPHWAQWWIDSGIFRADPKAPGRVFSLVIPPPNVTGSLHIGHMLEHTEIDVTVRWHRMRGDNTLWLPGTDHAGIATQMLVARQLASEGIQYRDLGREEFVKRVWQWKEQYGGTIKRQMIRMGSSCDWSRERFTLDPGLSRAVREVFVRLYEKGLIYRGEYMVNWCPKCHTALSDLEVPHDVTPGNLWHIRYPVNGTDRFVVVATTRPETMLGDTAVAMNPKDERYADLHGKTVRLPLMNRDIPIILDELADPEFGTGVVKVTPAHDPNDFEAGRRHNLPRIKVIDENAAMTAEAGPYAGLDRFEARKRVVADLEALGLLDKVEPYELSLGKCQRCKTPVEPLVSKQWFVKTKPLAEPAIKAVEDGRIKFTPENWTKTYYEWMYNIRDWCISRQLWWGHRVPAWHCKDCGEIIVAREAPQKCKCGSSNLEQDPDVLDTWFSSGLWPFSTLGWPDQTDELNTYYPTSLLITGFDILFFWVARMVMLGIEEMGDVPFREVYIHGLVRDAERQKMSKTKGNVVDPLVLTEQFGTDAVRMGLLHGAAPGTDIVLTPERMESARNFANKLWNAARFMFLNMERSCVDAWVPEPGRPCVAEVDTDTLEASLEDRWIFSRLNQVADLAGRAIEHYRYHEAAQVLWQFVWREFCDWYLEIKKLRFRENSGLDAGWRNILTVFEAMLRLLHPVMPFITEELWQRISANSADRPQSIALAPYPEYSPKAADLKAEREMELLQDIIVSARNLRADLGVNNQKQQLEGTLYSPGPAAKIARAQLEVIQKLAGVKLEIVESAAPAGVKGVKRATTEYDLVLQIPSEQSDVQRKRLEKEIEQLTKVIANSERQLSDEKFLARAPEAVVNSIKGKLAEYKAQLEKSRETLGALS